MRATGVDCRRSVAYEENSAAVDTVFCPPNIPGPDGEPAGIAQPGLINYGFSSISLGIENFIGNFSFGASIDIDKTDIRTLKTGRPDRFTVVDEWGYGSHFFVAWNVKSTQLEFSIRPFVQIPWKEVDLSPLADELEVNIPGDNLNENFMNFGVMFIFFNGPQ